MSVRVNHFQQPVGATLPDWQEAKRPGGTIAEGRYCLLERINSNKHATQLYQAYQQAPDERDWTYLSSGPFNTLEDYQAYLTTIETLTDPMHYAVMDKASGKAVGTVALMRIDAQNGVIEVGHLVYSPLMKRTRMATEVMALLLNYVFDVLGYRRFEWKCDSLNAPSYNAALRYGFSFEGVFRQALVTHQRNRDTAWFSIIDSEYPALRIAYENWLIPGNFDENGRQRNKLGALKSCFDPDGEARAFIR